jgi:protein phosphatase
MSVGYEAYAITHVGCVREHNEDGYLLVDMVRQEGKQQLIVNQLDWMVAVADGMGGANAGEIASRLALLAMTELSPAADEQVLKEWIERRIHLQIQTYGKDHASSRGLGTTLSGMLFHDNQALLFHVGDSRIYRFRDGYLAQLTTDHTLVEMLYRTGQIKEDEMAHHPERHVILQCLGGDNGTQVAADVFPLRGEVRDGDLFVLCTDGLSGCLTHEELETILAEGNSLQERAGKLLEAALAKGAPDNVTVALIQYREGEL